MPLTHLGLRQSAPPRMAASGGQCSIGSLGPRPHTAVLNVLAPRDPPCTPAVVLRLSLHNQKQSPSTSPSARVFRTSCRKGDCRKQPNSLQVLNAEEGIHCTRKSGLHRFEEGHSLRGQKQLKGPGAGPARQARRPSRLPVTSGAASARPGARPPPKAKSSFCDLVKRPHRLLAQHYLTRCLSQSKVAGQANTAARNFVRQSTQATDGSRTPFNGCSMSNSML